VRMRKASSAKLRSRDLFRAPSVASLPASTSAGSSGFSLLELMIVMAIILVIAAFAVPNMITTMDAFRMRGTLTSASGMVQKSRMQATKANTTQQLHVIVNAGQVVLYYKDANSPNPGLQTTDAIFRMPSQFTIPAGGAPAGPTPLTGLAMWGSNVNVTNINIDPYFNSRGMPCLPAAGGTCSPTNGFLYYFNYTNSGRVHWTALSVSPAGRIQNWFWNGTAWGN
jgi:prepilin-type N-terminal cleavage/methylation domain-containing protein